LAALARGANQVLDTQTVRTIRSPSPRPSPSGRGRTAAPARAVKITSLWRTAAEAAHSGAS